MNIQKIQIALLAIFIRKEIVTMGDWQVPHSIILDEELN